VRWFCSYFSGRIWTQVAYEGSFILFSDAKQGQFTTSPRHKETTKAIHCRWTHGAPYGHAIPMPRFPATCELMFIDKQRCYADSRTDDAHFKRLLAAHHTEEEIFHNSIEYTFKAAAFYTGCIEVEPFPSDKASKVEAYVYHVYKRLGSQKYCPPNFLFQGKLQQCPRRIYGNGEL